MRLSIFALLIDENAVVVPDDLDAEECVNFARHFDI